MLLLDTHIYLWINHRKSAIARRMRNRFVDHLAKFYWKPYFWHRAYDVGSVGGASLETVKRYVEAQGTKEKPSKAAPEAAARDRRKSLWGLTPPVFAV